MRNALEHVVVGVLRNMVLAEAACRAYFGDVQGAALVYGVGQSEAVAVASTCSGAILAEAEGVAIARSCDLTAHELHELPCGTHEGFLELTALAAVAAANDGECGNKEGD